MRSALLAAGAATALAAPFTPGNLAIVRAGDGVQALSIYALPTVIEERTPAGALVQSIALPTRNFTRPSGGQAGACNAYGSVQFESLPSLSTDGTKLVLAGYNTPLGISASFGNQRTVAVITADGEVDTSTIFTDASSNTVRSAATNDGNGFWVTMSSVSAQQEARSVPVCPALDGDR